MNINIAVSPGSPDENPTPRVYFVGPQQQVLVKAAEGVVFSGRDTPASNPFALILHIPCGLTCPMSARK